MFDWYEIFNYQEFNDSGLVSKSLSVFLEGVGFENILITKGEFTSILFRDAFLPIGFNNENPYGFGENYAVYKDSNEKVWVGIKVIEE